VSRTDRVSGRWRRAALLAAALLPAIISPAAAGDDEQRLQELRARLQTLQESLNQTREDRDAVREEVAALERRIGALVHNLRRIDAQLAADTGKLDELRARERRGQKTLAAHRRGLEREAYSAYALGRQEPLRLLLNQDDPARLTRVMTYYRYLNRARAEHIGRIKTALVRIETLDHQIRERGQELETARAEQLAQKQELEQARARRGELLASLNRKALSQSQEIERLRADEQRLERLLGELKNYRVDIPPPSGDERRFAASRGGLPLPARGRIVARFGEDKNRGDLKWRGIFVAAPEGRDVITVFRGRVAYADWLRGFGLLLIVDHGDGYLTLYGHNQSLRRRVGEWVEAGEVVASLGATGDAPQPGVYFEVRHNGEPHDPLRWCKIR